MHYSIFFHHSPSHFFPMLSFQCIRHNGVNAFYFIFWSFFRTLKLNLGFLFEFSFIYAHAIFFFFFNSMHYASQYFARLSCSHGCMCVGIPTTYVLFVLLTRDFLFLIHFHLINNME